MYLVSNIEQNFNIVRKSASVTYYSIMYNNQNLMSVKALLILKSF